MAQLPCTVRWRRVLTICLASVLLHYVVVHWAVDGLAPQGRPAQVAAPATVMARLRLGEAQPLAEHAPRVPAKVAQPRPGPMAQRPAAAVSAPASPAPEAAPGYQVSLPPSAQLAFALMRVEANGAQWPGDAEIEWRRDGAGYRLRSAAWIAGEEILPLVELASEGEVGQAGIAPLTMTEKRRGRSRTATHFNREQGSITFSASQARAALQAGAQDSATCLVQLAGIGRASSAQLAQGVRMLVATGREAREVAFVFGGQEEIETDMGRIAAWKMARPAPAGSYNAHLEIWLAPDHHWLPVQLRSTEANGTVTTQTVRRIVIKEN